MLFTAILSIAIGTGSLGDGGPTLIPQNSVLYQPAFCIDDVLRGPARPYYPQAGDISLATDESLGAKLGHRTGIRRRGGWNVNSGQGSVNSGAMRGVKAKGE